MNPLRIATRRSPLALWQAGHVQERLQAAHPGLVVELVPLTTSGDRFLDQSLSKAGGKGLFVKELEEALLARRADLAVHSMKDVPSAQPAGLALAAFLAGEDPRDAFVSGAHTSIAALPDGARVGTSSLRRQAQLRALRPDVQALDVRGNVGTRLQRLDEGRFDAILLACAGLKRLGLAGRITQALAASEFLPAIAQGVIGIECRADDEATRRLLAPLHDATSGVRLAAERAMNARLGAACHAPVAGHAEVRGATVHLSGLVAAPDGTRLVRGAIDGPAAQAAQLGATLAEQLLAGGGRAILQALGIAA